MLLFLTVQFGTGPFHCNVCDPLGLRKQSTFDDNRQISMTSVYFDENGRLVWRKSVYIRTVI